MSALLAIHVIAFLFSFFVAGCLLGAVFSRTFRESAIQFFRPRPLELIRSGHNPVLTPGGFSWSARSVFNPTALILADRTHLLYRAVGNDGVSRFGYAASLDGFTFDVRYPQPAYAVPGIEPKPANMKRFTPVVSSSGSTSGGAEDPRMVAIDGRVYVTFNLFNGWSSIRTAVISISEADFLAQKFDQWKGPHFLSKEGEIDKNWILFPEKIGGKFAILHSLYGDNESSVRVLYADDIETFTAPTDLAIRDPLTMPAQDIAWHARMKSAGPPPIKTNRGWLVLYHAISASEPTHYKLGAMLLDLADPTRVIARADYPILVPTAKYENEGKPGIVYACGATVKDGTLYLYYGGADKVVCVATAPLTPFLEVLARNIRNEPTVSSREVSTPLFVRGSNNPILAPQGNGFESHAVFNPAAIDIEGTAYLLYRAMGPDNTSTLGMAVSKDGTTVSERLSAPVYTPRQDFEKKHGNPSNNSGCEDPRIVRIGEVLYLTYTSYDGIHAPAGTIASISVADFVARKWSAWSKPHLVTPEGIDDKDLVILPEKVNGTYVLYHRINNRICADVVTDLASKKRISRCIEVLGPRPEMWDELKVGAAGPLIKTARGWLMIYHGISKDHVYRLGAALIGKDGITVLARSTAPLFEPVERYEKEGIVPNVVFSCGTVVRGDTLYLYYGAADRVVGVATASLSRVLETLS